MADVGFVIDVVDGGGDLIRRGGEGEMAGWRARERTGEGPAGAEEEREGGEQGVVAETHFEWFGDAVVVIWSFYLSALGFGGGRHGASSSVVVSARSVRICPPKG